MEVQRQETKGAAQEEDNASPARQLEAARQARQKEQEELTKQFEEARALLEEKIATLSKEVSNLPSADSQEPDTRRAIKPRLAETEKQPARPRELQAVTQLPGGKDRETAELSKPAEPEKRVSPPKEPPYTQTSKEPPYTKPQEPARAVSERHPILDKLSGVAPWVWIASAILIVILLYLVVRPSTPS